MLRTGGVGAATLALAITIGRVQAAPAPTPVWIDTDPAIGEPERDVDDGLALVQAFRSPELDLRGVSVVFGNAELARGLPIARRLVKNYGPPGLRVFKGAAAASDLQEETEASRALAAALHTGPLTILALGPATNVATVLSKHPDLAARVVRVIAVAGRRPGQRFTTGTTNPAGHRDFNFELDPKAFQVLLDSHVELVLAPFEIASKVWLDDADLDRLASSSSAAARALAAAGQSVALIVDPAVRGQRLQSVRYARRRLCDFSGRLRLRTARGAHRDAGRRCDRSRACKAPRSIANRTCWRRTRSPPRRGA